MSTIKSSERLIIFTRVVILININKNIKEGFNVVVLFYDKNNKSTQFQLLELFLKYLRIINFIHIK